MSITYYIPKIVKIKRIKPNCNNNYIIPYYLRKTINHSKRMIEEHRRNSKRKYNFL